MVELFPLKEYLTDFPEIASNSRKKISFVSGAEI